MSFGFGFALPAYPLRGGGGNNPFNQLGPTLDLSFTGVVTDLTDPNGYTLNTDFIIPQYQIAAQYLIWETGVGLVDKTFSQIITFTRASTGTYFDSAGVLQSAAIDAPRFDYNPATLAAQGLLIEEARTNSLLQSDWAGAVGGSPGTAPTSWTLGAVTGTPTTTLVTSIYGASGQAVLFSGVTGDRLWYQQSINVTSGTTYTATIFCETITGTPGDVIQVVAGTAARTIIADNALNPASGTRASVVFSATSTGTIILRYGIGTDATIAADATAQLSRPQVEAGAFPTSYIPTTTTALTRSADVASVNTLSPWFNATEGTLFADWTSFIPNGTSPGSTYAAGFTDNIATSGAAQLTIQNRAVSNQIRVWQSTTGGGLDDFITPTNTTFQGKAAATYGGGSNVNASANGGAVVTMTNPIQTTAFNALLLGLFTTAATGSGSNYLNGHLRRIAYYPRRLSNAELVSITS